MNIGSEGVRVRYISDKELFMHLVIKTSDLENWIDEGPGTALT